MKRTGDKNSNEIFFLFNLGQANKIASAYRCDSHEAKPIYDFQKRCVRVPVPAVDMPLNTTHTFCCCAVDIATTRGIYFKIIYILRIKIKFARTLHSEYYCYCACFISIYTLLIVEFLYISLCCRASLVCSHFLLLIYYFLPLSMSAIE